MSARLARRQAWRAKGSSALVVLLVALPVTGLSGGAIFWQSHEPTPQQRATLELGGNQAWLEALDNANPTRWQAVDMPWDNDVERLADGTPTREGGPVPEDPEQLLPAGTDVLTVTEGNAGVETIGGPSWITTVSGDVWNPAFDGKYLLIEGEAPSGPDEMMATPGALERVGARLGDRIRFVDHDRELTVTGTLRSARDEASVEVLFVPETASPVVDGGYVRWYTPHWQPSLTELSDLNHAGFIAYARDLALAPPPGARVSEWGDGGIELWNVVLIGVLIAVFSGYIVVLLAGAAFSVAARRQQRALAMTASVGAARSDVFRIVLLQGTVLGVAGAAAGVALGAAGAALLLAATDRGALDTFWGNFGFRAPWALVAAVAGFAVVVGTLAALVPARRATKGDIMGALRGARRPALLRPRRPLFGLIVLATGLAATAAGALVMAAELAAPREDGYSTLFFVAVWAVVLGPFVFQIGLLIPSHWVIVQLSRPLSLLGLAPRIASRDAAATPSRVVPAFAVIGACVFAAAVAIEGTALTAGANARMHFHSAPLGALVVTLWQESDEATDLLLAAADDIVGPTEPTATALVSSQAWPASSDDGSAVPGDATFFGVARQRWTGCLGSTCMQPFEMASGPIHVIEPRDVATVLGIDPGTRALEAMERGAALVTQPDFLTADGEMIVTEWEPQSYLDLMSANGGPGSGSGPLAEHVLPAVGVEVGHQQPFEIVIAPRTASSLGIEVVPTQLIATYDEPLSQQALDALPGPMHDLRVSPTAGVSAVVERGPQPVDPALWLILGAAVALVVGASAVALGLARFERRPDDATLAAVGGGRLLRRNINAWQAIVIVATGTVVGSAAACVSMWGFATANTSFYDLADMPWLWLLLLALGLPIGIAVAAWLVPPRHPDLTRRTVVT